ncbi:MAG: hypothetical protein KF883_17065 [Thermomicrobiales bacterium]|nr:hypothetical protein [Thermomicrobiales bacterium]
MGHQLEGGRELFRAAILSGTGNGIERFPGSGNAQPAQKPLSLPRHLVRPASSIDFAHPTEQDLARVFSFYRVEWVYEPTTFHLTCDETGRPTEQVCPDFYLPQHDVYVELTTMRQSLVTRKNRKIRRLKEAFPTVQIRLMYRKDYDRLMGSVFGVNGHATTRIPGKPIHSDGQLQQRVAGLAAEIAASRCESRNVVPDWGRHAVMPEGRVATASGGNGYGDDPVCLIGLGSSALRFLGAMEAALAAEGVPSTTDALALTRPGNESDDRVRVLRKPGCTIDGRDVVLVADVVSTGLSATFAADWLRQQGARSVRVCSLFDRTDARILDLPIAWTGFAAPDDVLVGYGISYQDQFDDLPMVAPLRAPSRPRLKTKPESESHQQ